MPLSAFDIYNHTSKVSRASRWRARLGRTCPFPHPAHLGDSIRCRTVQARPLLGVDVQQPRVVQGLLVSTHAPIEQQLALLHFLQSILGAPPVKWWQHTPCWAVASSNASKRTLTQHGQPAGPELHKQNLACSRALLRAGGAVATSSTEHDMEAGPSSANRWVSLSRTSSPCVQVA